VVGQLFEPEFRLAAACSMWPPDAARASRIETLVGESIDWTHFLKVTHRHRVIGLVRHGLHPFESRISRDFMTELNEAAATQLRHSFLQVTESNRIVQLLRARDIPVVLLKGVPVSLLAYGNLALRQSKDIDFLVSPEHAAGAAAVIECAGYVRIRPSAEWQGKALAGWQRHQKHFEYLHRATGVQLELHWRIFLNPRFLDVQFSSEKFQEVAVSSNCSLPAFRNEELLLYLCLHGSVHAWFRLKWLADVNALLQKGGSGAASSLLALAERHDVRQPVAAGLELCRQIFQTVIPPVVLRPALRLFVATAISAMTAGGSILEPNEERFGTTRMSFSNYLLGKNWRHLRDQFKIDFMAPDKVPSALSSWARPFLRTLSWFRNRRIKPRDNLEKKKQNRVLRSRR
jgi:hypothetical protein